MLAESYVEPRRWSIAVCVSLAIGLGAACGAAPAKTKPRVHTSVAALVKQAKQHERKRRYDKARVLYTRAKTEAPDDHSRAFAGRSLALALIFWGEYAGAETELEGVLRLYKGDVASWHDLGMLRHRRGDLLGAEQSFRTAIKLRSNNPRTRIALAALLWKSKRLADALVEYKALLQLELPPRIRDKVRWAIKVLQRKLDSAVKQVKPGL